MWRLQLAEAAGAANDLTLPTRNCKARVHHALIDSQYRNLNRTDLQRLAMNYGQAKGAFGCIFVAFT